MSACNRKIERLPLSVFQNLIIRSQVVDRDDHPESLKQTICDRLKRFRVRNDCRRRNKKNHGSLLGISSPTTTTCRIKTIGELLLLSKYTIMLALDPVLTYEEVEIFLERICNQCAPKPRSVLKLLRASNIDTDLDGNFSKNKISGNVIVQSKLAQVPQEQKGGRQPHNTDPVSFGKRMGQLPTSLPSLDRILRGGIRLSQITELVGRSGVGKTQLAFQLCITAAKFNQGAIYIDTEKKMSLTRLKEMSEQWRMLRHHDHDCSEIIEDGDALATFKSDKIVLDNLTVHRPGNSEELLEVLDGLEYEILIRNQTAGDTFSEFASSEVMTRPRIVRRAKYPVRLLILDSIAAPIRRDFGIGAAPQRAAAIFQCAQKLKRLAEQLHLAIVVINQVTSGEGVGAISNLSAPTSARAAYQEPVRAALGTSWHHCVSTRLVLELEAANAVALESRDSSKLNVRNTRKITVEKSNRTGFRETLFNISAMGIVEA